MIRFFLRERMADKGFQENRRITLDDVVLDTGISKNTLSRISSTKGYNTTTENLDRLCKYFGCSLSDLAVYVDEE